MVTLGYFMTLCVIIVSRQNRLQHVGLNSPFQASFEKG